MKKYWLISISLLFLGTVNAQYTSIPDPRFERALIDLGIDSDQTINGQILTSDASGVTDLEISPNSISGYPYPAEVFQDGMIHDLTGLEAFVNLEDLKINITMVEAINLEPFANLRHLDIVENLLTSIDVSNNKLLEYIDVTSGGDLIPYNEITELDLSNNPNIKTVLATGVNKLNLRNGNNSEIEYVNMSCFCWGIPPGTIIGNVCVSVDDAAAASADQQPYSDWNFLHGYYSVNFVDDYDQCALANPDFHNKEVVLFPNPVNTGVLYINVGQVNGEVSQVTMFDITGRKVLDQSNSRGGISVSHLQKGAYILKAEIDGQIYIDKFWVN